MKDEKQKSLKEIVRKAVDILKRGGIVAAATETFFGLLADIERPGSIERLRRIKKLPEPTPTLIVIPSMKHLKELCEKLSPHALRLAERYWPGPLTMIVRARMTVPEYLLGPYHTMALRIPGECDAADILRLFGKPLTATSCNIHGEPPVHTGRQALEIFKRKLDLIVPGTSPGGLPSTIVDATVTPPVVRRPGIVKVEGKYLR